MTWSDFLRYSKYIAVFYAIAFMIGIIGIWAEPHGQWIWTAAMFFGAALAGNVALGFYHANHQGSMVMAKNEYLAKAEEAQVITGETTKALDFQRRAVNSEMDELMKDKVRQVIREERGY
jgi:hypothetical protein